MSLLKIRRNRLLSAVRLYQAGPNRVIWRNGVLYCGGTLFVLYNALDYLIEPRARATATQLAWFFLALLASLTIGYIYGRVTWRSLRRIFTEQPGQSANPVQ